MQLPSISHSATLATHGDGYCGTPVPGVIPHHGPGPLDRVAGLLDKVALNPQPLPPSSKFSDEFPCGTVPHVPFPPVPHHVGGLLR